MVHQRAKEKARLIIGQAHHTMGLEDQQVLDAAQKALFDRLVRDLLDGNLARLWDEP